MLSIRSARLSKFGDPTPFQGRESFKTTLILGFSSLGAIYGDIGTSPLYVFSSIFPEGVPSEDHIVGAMSCIFWVFTLIVVVKYCFIVLFFGPNNNEGGQVAIYAKIAGRLSIGPKGVPLIEDEEDLLTITRSETHDNEFDTSGGTPPETKWYLRFTPKGGRFNKILVNKYLSPLIMGLCFLGCGLVISDGLLTPTTSVLSAVDGIAVAAPSFQSKVMPVSCVILLMLFSIQGFGSGLLLVLFAPCIFTWLLLLLVSGIINIARYRPGIFAALNPAQAVWFLRSYHDIDKLGAVMLAITGTEAMFADIGHFLRLSVQLTLGGFVFPCLMMQYLGQAAYLTKHPEGIANVFYLSIPGGPGTPFYWIVFAFATVGTVIASQALILGVFSILRQLIHLDCFPNFKVVHTSSKNSGRIYIPAVNYILMVAVICTCVGFRTSSNVTAAYGLGVAMDFVVTSLLISICLLYVYRVKILVAVAYLAVLLPLEMCLVVSGLRKVPYGAWFTLMVATLMTSFLAFWRGCRSLVVNQEYASRVKVKSVIEAGEKPLVLKLGSSATAGDHAIEYKVRHGKQCYDFHRYNGVGIMYTNVVHDRNSASVVPQLFQKLVTSFPCAPDRLIFLSARVVSVPYIKVEDHIILRKMKLVPTAGLYQCVVKFGFMDKMTINNSTVEQILKRVDLEEADEESPISNVKSSTEEHREDRESLAVYIKDLYGSEHSDLKDEPKTRVLHIIENSLIKSRKIPHELYEDSNVIVRGALRAREFVRTMVIQNVFAPINSMFGGFETSLDFDDDGSDLILVGNNVRI